MGDNPARPLGGRAAFKCCVFRWFEQIGARHLAATGPEVLRAPASSSWWQRRFLDVAQYSDHATTPFGRHESSPSGLPRRERRLAATRRANARRPGRRRACPDGSRAWPLPLSTATPAVPSFHVRRFAADVERRGGAALSQRRHGAGRSLDQPGTVIEPVVGSDIAVQGKIFPAASLLDVVGPFEVEGGRQR